MAQLVVGQLELTEAGGEAVLGDEANKVVFYPELLQV